MTPSIYINLEDDVAAIATRLKKERAGQVVVVCPKRCLLFAEPINLKLLKTQAELLGKEISILTMDEKGRAYARQAGLRVRDLPAPGRSRDLSDIKPATSRPQREQESRSSQPSYELPSVKFSENRNSQSRSVPGTVITGPSVVTQASMPELEPEPIFSENSIPQENLFPKELEDKIRDGQSHSSRRVTVFMILSGLLLFSAVFLLVLPRAEVVIFPKTEPVSRDMEISLSEEASAADLTALVLPATKVAESVRVNEKFQSQGKQEVGSTATGSVRIYNFTGQTINLRSDTTIISLNGKNYRLNVELAQVKPARYSNSRTKEVDQSSLPDPVEVVAVQGGESSNLPAGTRLEISNQVFGSRPQVLYARTETPISGGVSRYLSVISQQDVSAAQNELGTIAIEQLRARLAQQGLLLLDNAFSVQIANFQTDKPSGTQTPNFTAELELSVSGLAFDREELRRLIFNRISQTISSEKNLLPDPGLESTYRIKSVDLPSGKAVLSARFQSKSLHKVNADGVAALLAGKSESQASQILLSDSGIDRVDVTLAPTWQHYFPWIKQRIKVILSE